MMDPADSADPYRRPARRTQWIVSTLAYHYGLDRGVENEIIVLATGLDQYLQEIFHHLDYQSKGRIPLEDFHILCDVLGLSPDPDPEDCESAGVRDSLPAELSFRHFHAKLCGYFSNKAGCGYEKDRLLVGHDSRHIETQIRLRSPLKRQDKLASGSALPTAGCRLGPCNRDCYEEIVALEEAEDRVAEAEDRVSKLEEENSNLRELIEDMRAALQSSDARCLALQVGLWKSHSSHRSMKKTKKTSSSCSHLNSLHNIIQEMEVLHSSREQQVEEARERGVEMREWQVEAREQWVEEARERRVEEVLLYNHRLEQEVCSSREAALALDHCNQALKREQAIMRRKVEEARQALLSGLAKVKELEVKVKELEVKVEELEVKAKHVPALQRHILHLESELLYYRSEVSTGQLNSRAHQQQLSSRADQQQLSSGTMSRRCGSDSQRDRCSPTGQAVSTPNKTDDQLFRSVEGQAASDEEEDKWNRDKQRQVDEVKKMLSRLSCCGDRCEDKAFRKLVSNFGSSRSEENCSTVVELLERVTCLHQQLELKESQTGPELDQMKEALVQELHQQEEEEEVLQMELQMLEKEKVRMALVEKKLLDILHLLQQLRDLVKPTFRDC